MRKNCKILLFHISKFSKDNNLPAYCEVVLANEENNGYFIEETWKIEWNMPFIYQHWGAWSPKDGLQAPTEDHYHRHGNLHGYNYQVMEDAHMKIIKIMRREDSLEFFSKHFNFTILIKESPKEMSLVFKNGTRTGVFKSAFEKSVDIVNIPYVVSSNRLDCCSYIWPITVFETLMFVTANATKNGVSYLKPFDADVWVGFVIWFSIAFLALTCIFRSQRSRWLLSLSDAFLQVFGPFTEQFVEEPSFPSTVLLAVMVYITALFFVSSYKGGISAFLTVPFDNIPFENFEGFIADGTHRLTFRCNTFYDFFFYHDEGTLATDMRSRGLLIAKDNLPDSYQKSFRQLCEKPKRVVLSTLYPEQQESCRIIRLKEKIFSQHVGLLTRDDFPYSTAMILVLRKLEERGIKPYYKNLPPDVPDASTEPIGLDIVIWLLYILFLFWCLAGLILVVEILNKKAITNKLNESKGKKFGSLMDNLKKCPDYTVYLKRTNK